VAGFEISVLAYDVAGHDWLEQGVGKSVVAEGQEGNLLRKKYTKMGFVGCGFAAKLPYGSMT